MGEPLPRGVHAGVADTVVRAQSRSARSGVAGSTVSAAFGCVGVAFVGPAFRDADRDGAQHRANAGGRSTPRTVQSMRWSPRGYSQKRVPGVGIVHSRPVSSRTRSPVSSVRWRASMAIPESRSRCEWCRRARRGAPNRARGAGATFRRRAGVEDAGDNFGLIRGEQLLPSR